MLHIFKNFLVAIWVFIKDTSIYIYRNVQLRYIFSFNTLFKLCFLYCATILWIILFSFTLPKNINHNAPTIAVYTTIERIGEKLLYDRIVIAAKSIGWNVIGGEFPEAWVKCNYTRPFYYAAASIINFIFKPKFNLAVTHYVHLLPSGYNIVYLNVPNEMLFSQEGKFKSTYAHLADYDAYIDLYSVANGSNPTLLEALKKINKTDAQIIPLYLAQNYVEYSSATKNQALLVGSLWGCNRNSLRMMQALQQLSKSNLLVAYGLDSLKPLGQAYKGALEGFEPKILSNSLKLLALQKKYGISIVVHNLDHMLAGMPTSRIAESVAAGSIVISDEHPFIKKFFGDNVLYIDDLKSAEEIHSQIYNHIMWINANPEEAEVKAKNAYDIFIREMLLENQLHKLNDSILSNDNSKKIR